MVRTPTDAEGVGCARTGGLLTSMGFPGKSVGKESACNAADLGPIPGLGRSGEEIGYPLQYTWASLVIRQ